MLCAILHYKKLRCVSRTLWNETRLTKWWEREKDCSTSLKKTHSYYLGVCFLSIVRRRRRKKASERGKFTGVDSEIWKILHKKQDGNAHSSKQSSERSPHERNRTQMEVLNRRPLLYKVRRMIRSGDKYSAALKVSEFISYLIVYQRKWALLVDLISSQYYAQNLWRFLQNEYRTLLVYLALTRSPACISIRSVF